MRIDLKSSTSDLSPPLKTHWQEILLKASRELTDIVILHNKSPLDSLREIEAQLRRELLVTVHEAALLDIFLEKKKRSLRTQRDKKFLRDGVALPPTKLDLGIDTHLSRSLPTSVSVVNISSPPVSYNSAPPAAKPTTFNNVVNLSSVRLSDDECMVLSKGLNFCPDSGKLNELQLYKDLENLSQNLRLKEYYHKRPQKSDPSPEIPSITDWTPPPQSDKCLDLYIKAVQKDILSEFEKRHYDTLTSQT